MRNPTPFESTLRRHGYSMTASRQHVFAALQGQEAMSMHELVADCPNIDRASVYRAVTLFEKLGIVLRIQTGWKYKIELTGIFHSHHHHASCLRCGRSFVAPEDETIEQRLQQLAKTMNFQLENHQLELRGYCGNCSEALED